MKKKYVRICSLLMSFVMVLTIVLSLIVTSVMAVSRLTYNGSDSYMSGSYYKRLTSVTLTGSKRTDIISIANSQIGYCEGNAENDYSGAADGINGNYTEYNYWFHYNVSSDMPFGGEYGPWCATFVSWCAYLAGVPDSIIHRNSSTVSMLEEFEKQNREYTRSEIESGKYTPQRGDIIFFKFTSGNNNRVNHVGIVSSYSNSTVYLVDGNGSKNGKQGVWDKQYSITDTSIQYICSPDYEGTGGTEPDAPTQPTTAPNDDPVMVNIPSDLKDWVFNADYYRNRYDSLSSMSDDQLYNHFVYHGISEGRQASALFNVSYYLSQHKDLVEQYGSDYIGAFEHFTIFGQYETSRVYSAELTAIKDYIFDASFYRTMYPSDTQSLGSDAGELFAHFIKTGMGKGYTASPAFDIAYYASANPDIKSAYGTDYFAAIHHFIKSVPFPRFWTPITISAIILMPPA